MSLANRIAVVTGAAQGIGAAIAAALGAQGAHVAVWDVAGDRAAAVASELADKHRVRTLGLAVDVADVGSVDRAVARTEDELGPIDILVNNAGVDTIGPFLTSDVADWDRIVAVNLRGPLLCCHRVVARMVERGSGRVVNIGSDAGRVGSSGEAVYSATKGGVIAFTKTLAREVARHGVTVNCVCPGPTDTALLAQVADASPKLRTALERAIPLGRVAEPGDVAPMVVFLAGDGARYVTGQTVSVSGGLTMC